MVHDEKPSDIWWHDTDTQVLKIHQQFMYRVEFERKCERLNKETQEIASILKAKLDEALIHDQYRRSAGVITRAELMVTEVWYQDAVTLLGLVFNLWKKLRGLSEVESELVFSEAKKLMSQLREKIRDHYLFDRQIEERFPA